MFIWLGLGARARGCSCWLCWCVICAARRGLFMMIVGVFMLLVVVLVCWCCHVAVGGFLNFIMCLLVYLRCVSVVNGRYLIDNSKTSQGRESDSV